MAAIEGATLQRLEIDQHCMDVSNDAQAMVRAMDLTKVYAGCPEYYSIQWRYVGDQNGSTFSGGQIQLDTTGSENDWVDWSKAFWAIPVSVSATMNFGAAGVYAALSPFAGAVGSYAQGVPSAIGLKNGSWMLIEQIQIMMNGQTSLTVNTRALPALNTFRAMAEMSYDALLQQGAIMSFWPDDTDSILLTEAAAGSIRSYRNNIVVSYQDRTISFGQGYAAAAGGANSFALAPIPIDVPEPPGAAAGDVSPVQITAALHGAAGAAVGQPITEIRTTAAALDAIPTVTILIAANTVNAVRASAIVKFCNIAATNYNPLNPGLSDRFKDVNEGFLQRIKFNSASALPENSQGNYQNIYRNFYAAPWVTGTPLTITAKLYQWMLIIPLAKLHDVFKNLNYPTRGSKFFFTASLNQVSKSSNNAMTGGANNNGMCTAGGVVNQGNTNPLMMSNLGCGTIPLYTQGTDAAGYTLEGTPWGVNTHLIQDISLVVGNYGVSNDGTNTIGGMSAMGFTSQSRIYYPACQLPARVLEYMNELILQNKYVKKIRYYDHQWYKYQATIIQNTSVNWNVVTGLPAVKRLHFIPFFSTSAFNMAGTGIAPYLSCTTSEPGHCSPYCWFYNISVYIDNQQYFNPNLQYNYETFIEQIQQAFTNPGHSVVASGLFTFNMWQKCQWLFFDVRRKTPEPRIGNINFVGTLATAFPVELWCIAEYERILGMNIALMSATTSVIDAV